MKKKVVMMKIMPRKMMVGNMPKPAAHARHSSETALKISVSHPQHNPRKHFTDDETEAQRG